MRAFARRHRRLAILLYVLMALLPVVLVVPYLVPLGRPDTEVPLEDLVTANGRFVDIDGMSIYIEEHGPRPARGTIVFLHGFGGSTFSWRHNVPFFAGEGYRVISLDMKGFGLSHKDFGSDYSHPAQAELVADVLAELDVEQAYIVGHSMGTSVMLHFAHAYPEMVLGLVSAAGAVELGERSAFPGVLLRFGPFRRAAGVFLTRFLTKERAGVVLEDSTHHDIVTGEVVDGYYHRIVTGDWQWSLLGMTRDMHRNTITFPLEGIAVPTTVLWGEYDRVVKREDIDEWKDRFSKGEFHLIQDAGHLPMEERPERFNELVLAFLETAGG